MLRVFSARQVLFVSLFFVASLSRGIASPPVAPTEALSPEEEKKKFKLPPGFEAQLVAAEPDIQKPMNLAFDARGRLWVTHSVEYPFAADGSKARDALSVLEFDATGKVSKVTRFADKLNIPIGVLPLAHRNEAIVWSIPNIWRLTDTDGDGVADKREILYGTFGFGDTHGNQNAFRRGLDGWIYSNHGFANHSKVKLKGVGPVVLEMTSGNTYRYRDDGSAMQQHTWGQVNPFGSCFDHRNDWFNSDCHSRPIMMMVRGGWYESFGTRNDGLGLAPPVTQDGHGSTGLAGIAYCDNSAFPKQYQGGFFVGNVVNNSIHFDMPTHRGSSPWVEKPVDFMTSDDWWFRPVDIQLGPDGAIYVADFYNCIIGHYEVDLKHPRRDRERGRIWRIVWKGLDGKTPYRAPEDLTKLSAEQLVERIGSGNITVRVQCLHQLVDRFGVEGAKSLEAKAATTNQHVMAIWMRYRLGTLAGSDLKSLLKGDPTVRVHLAKALAELDTWTSAQHAFVRELAGDPDPFVRRAAAEALGRHPDADHVPALVKIWDEAGADDVQLVHTARIALRNQFMAPNLLGRLAKTPFSAGQALKAIDIALATPTESAAQFGLQLSMSSDVPHATFAQSLQHAARYLKPEQVDELAEFVQKNYPTDRQVQFSLFQSIHEGIVQRGGKLEPNTSVGKWAERLVRFMLNDEKLSPPPLWSQSALNGTPSNTKSWAPRARACADGEKDVAFFDSLEAGEQYTGILRSPAFTLPATLSFWVVGHDQKPNTNSEALNHVRLKLVEGGEIIQRENAPNSDNAKQVVWDVKAWVGKKAMIEVVDANSANSYAWIGVGRFEPAVVTQPRETGSVGTMSLSVAIDLVGKLKLVDLLPRIQKVVRDKEQTLALRSAAAQSALTLASTSDAVLADVLTDLGEPTELRKQIAQLLAPVNSAVTRAALAKSLETAAPALQQSFAVALASTQEGADTLLKTIAGGKASPYLLQDNLVLERIRGAKPMDAEMRIASLTKNLAPADERIRKLLASRAKGFETANLSPERGIAVFKQHCAVCHKANGEGALIGPQLEGMGVRGVERLVEDVLDPNRNVEAAFRPLVIATNSGKVITGLKRREEGQAIIVADNQGKEIRIPLEDIAEQHQSNLSLMPGNVVDVVPEDDFYHLMGFLLSLRAK